MSTQRIDRQNWRIKEKSVIFRDEIQILHFKIRLYEIIETEAVHLHITFHSKLEMTGLTRLDINFTFEPCQISTYSFDIIKIGEKKNLRILETCPELYIYRLFISHIVLVHPKFMVNIAISFSTCSLVSQLCLQIIQYRSCHLTIKLYLFFSHLITCTNSPIAMVVRFSQATSFFTQYNLTCFSFHPPPTMIHSAHCREISLPEIPNPLTC